MKTSQKLREVFENIRPHINGHRTIINKFLESINEVEEMEALSQHDVMGSNSQANIKAKVVNIDTNFGDINL